MTLRNLLEIIHDEEYMRILADELIEGDKNYIKKNFPSILDLEVKQIVTMKILGRSGLIISVLH